MVDLFFEEFLGACGAENIAGGKCRGKGLLRRTMGVEYRTMGVPYCRKCMPEFFINPHHYPVFKAIKSKTQDPIYENYVEFYNKRFTYEARQEMSL